MAINFRWPQFLKSIRFGSTLAWGEFSGQGIIKTLTGSLPLILNNTIKQPIKSLVQYGKCEQDGTPTPSNPVDIVCNNGTVKWGASGTNLLDMAEENIRLRYYINDSGAETSNNQNFYNTKFIPVKPNTAYTLSTSEPVYYTSIMEYDSNKDFLQRTLEGDSSDKHSSMTITTRADTAYILIGSNPVRATMYIDDVTSINWMLNEGSTALPYEPYNEDIVIDGTSEVLSVSGKNLLKMPTFDEVTNASQVVNYWSIPIKLEPNTTYYLSSHYLNDYTSVGKNFYVLITADATANTDYATIAHKSVGIRDRELTTDDSGYLYFRVNGAARTLYEEMLANTEAQLELGSAATSYEPYREPQTASVQNLYAVGDYADTQDIISGAVTRKVKVYIFDGTEAWERPSGADYFRLNGMFEDAIPYDSDNPAIVCSHFVGKPSKTSASGMSDGDIKLGYTSIYNRMYLKYAAMTSADDLKAYLAAQYAAGTPVIVLYPLAEETTETVTGQILKTEEGTTSISAIAEIAPIDVEIKYSALDE